VSFPHRIAQTFERCQGEGRAALITYVMGGDPNPMSSQLMAMACVEGGADLLEIGIPFSDPIADGPTIQRASERALAAGTTVADCFAVAHTVRKKCETPIALMGYLNPVLAYGQAEFLRVCPENGVDAVILPDLPPEEAEDFCAQARRYGVGTVFLLAPTSTPARWEAVFRRATAFVYFVSVTGVTGARTELPPELPDQLDRVRSQSPVPVVVGFGISNARQAAQVARHANGIVVGSAIVSEVASRGTLRERVAQVRKTVQSLRKGLKG